MFSKSVRSGSRVPGFQPRVLAAAQFPHFVCWTPLVFLFSTFVRTLLVWSWKSKGVFFFFWKDLEAWHCSSHAWTNYNYKYAMFWRCFFFIFLWEELDLLVALQVVCVVCKTLLLQGSSECYVYSVYSCVIVLSNFHIYTCTHMHIYFTFFAFIFICMYILYKYMYKHTLFPPLHIVHKTIDCALFLPSRVCWHLWILFM